MVNDGRRHQPEREVDRSVAYEAAVAVEAIAVALERDDPEFVRRMQRLDRAATVNAIVVLTLFATAAVLIVAGLAVQQLSSVVCGAVTMIGAFGVDARFQRHLRRHG